MADPRSTSGNEVDPAVAARERQVEQNRERLAETVDALQDKLDVKAQAQDKVRTAKAQVLTADGRPRPVLLAVVAGLAVVSAVLVWRRHR